MPLQRKATKERVLGYPSEETVLQRFMDYETETPDVVYRTCTVKLHNVSRRDEAALLQVFKNNTLAACWMLRDIEQRKPRQLFADCRNRNSSHYLTQRIKNTIDKRYREKIRGRYQISSSVFEGLCVMLASMISAWLHKMAEAEDRGDLQRYQVSGAFIVPIGKHAGKSLGSLRRKTIIGYARLLPTEALCDEVLGHLDVLLDNQQADHDERFEQAASYQMEFGPRQRDRLGTMRSLTLQRLRAIVQRERGRAEVYAVLRSMAQTYLSFTPPGFPHIESDGLSPGRRRELCEQHLMSLEAYGALPDIDDEQMNQLTEDERARFRQLQQDAFAATGVPYYAPIHFLRADGWLAHRDLGLAYDPVKRRYVALLYILARTSRHRQPLTITGQLCDVNNPSVKGETSARPSTAMIFELECGRHQRAILDQARGDVDQWKEKKGSTAGSICSGSLSVSYDEKRRRWIFELSIAMRTAPAYIMRPEHVIGVHCDPRTGYHLSVLSPQGEFREYIPLTEHKIAALLGNRAEQGLIAPETRTVKEQQHRIADAIVALCLAYRAAVGVEDIAYLRESWTRSGKSAKQKPGAHSSRGMVELLRYKLPLAYLPNVLDIYGISPTKDCGVCGARNPDSLAGTRFICPGCQNEGERYANIAREVARRTLWLIGASGKLKGL